MVVLLYSLLHVLLCVIVISFCAKHTYVFSDDDEGNPKAVSTWQILMNGVMYTLLRNYDNAQE